GERRDEPEEGFVELRRVHGQAGRARSHPAERGVVEGGRASRREAHAEDASRGTAVVAAREETAHPDAREGDPEEQRQSVEERRQRLAPTQEVERRDGDPGEEPSVRGASGAEDGCEGARGERGGDRAHPLEDVAAGERG